MSYTKCILLGGLLLLTACGSSGSSGGGSEGNILNSLFLDRSIGVTEFITPVAAGFDAINPTAVGGFATTAGEAGAPPASSPVAVERKVEESDIYHLEGDRLFILNRYRGLQILDISDLDAPRFLGRFAIYGQPKQMYVRGSVAYVLLSDAYGFAVAPATTNVVSSYGSRILAIDVANPQLPASLGQVEIEGEIIDSRIVGNMLYVVSGAGDRTRIVSVAVGGSPAFQVVDAKDFPRNGWEHNACVTTGTIYLASSGSASVSGVYQTAIQLIDISDPAGVIRSRGKLTVAGRVLDRWSLDEYQGVLRVATSQNWGNGDVYLNTFSVTDPDQPAALGSKTLYVAEQLKSARFDGPRGYLVSYRAIDPLFTFDLSDPAKPIVLGELQMSGWLDFLVPLGDRAVSLGHEDTVAPDGRRVLRLAVSLIDVSRSQTPTLLSRVVLAGEGGWVPGDRNDFAKVFRVIPEQNLILFPFSSWSPADGRYMGGIQLIDLGRDALTRRAIIRDAGWVERGVPRGSTDVLTIGSEIFQAMDIVDRDHPRLRSRLELARNVLSFAPLTDEYGIELSGDSSIAAAALSITPLADPDTTTPVARLQIPAAQARLFPRGGFAYLLAQEEVRDVQGNVTSYTTRVRVADATNPLQPKLRGSTDLPGAGGTGTGSWFWGDEALLLDGGVLAVLRPGYSATPVVQNAQLSLMPYEKQTATLHIVDLANPDAPKVASSLTFADAGWTSGLKAAGRTLYLSAYREVMYRTDGSYVRYELRRIDVADPLNPRPLPPVNIPGIFVNASANGAIVYTMETMYDSAMGKTSTFFHALAIEGDRAILLSSVELPGFVSGSAAVQGNTAVATISDWGGVVMTAGGAAPPIIGGTAGSTRLVTIDLSDPGNLRIAGQADVPSSYVYLQKIEAGRAFLSSGSGVFSYRVDDPAHPKFESFFRTQGNVQDITVRGTRAFLPSGYYGVQVLNLGG